MSDEPATRHFTPAELASFLHELELAHPNVQPDSGLSPLPLGLSSLPRPHDHGTARYATARRQSERARARSGSRETVRTPGSDTTSGVGNLRRHGAAPTRSGVPPRISSPKRHRRFGLPFGKLARRAGLALLVCAGLAGVAWGMFTLRSCLVSTVRPRRLLMPPPLPIRAALPAPVARDQTCGAHTDAAPAAPSRSVGPAGASQPATEVRSEVRPPEPRALAAVDDARPAAGARTRALPGFDELLRREAVELLLSGRTREALEAYRALPVPLRTPAVLEVMRYLERELATCAERAGTACGSR